MSCKLVTNQSIECRVVLLTSKEQVATTIKRYIQHPSINLYNESYAKRLLSVQEHRALIPYM